MQKNVELSIRELAASLAACTDPDLVKDFLESLLTPKELDDVASRWTLVKLIREGKSQRAISKELGISLCKITRGSKELKKENSPFTKMLDLS